MKITLKTPLFTNEEQLFKQLRQFLDNNPFKETGRPRQRAIQQQLEKHLHQKGKGQLIRVLVRHLLPNKKQCELADVDYVFIRTYLSSNHAI